MKFNKRVIDKLQYYVYRLIDPRNGETFYVGKGKDNRVFQHINEKIKPEVDEDKLSLKFKRIREIKALGLEVLHVIHRHGMDEKTSLMVEAALIDAYPGLANLQTGKYSGDFGVMHVKEVINRYNAMVANFDDKKLLLINVNKTAEESGQYLEAVRFAWKIDPVKANQAEFILATYQGMIIGAYQTVDKGWIKATSVNFPGRTTVHGRFGFIGEEASDNIQKLYVGKQVPEEYRKKGASNPIRYSW